MRCGSTPVGPDPHVCLRPGTVKIRESDTASNYGSGIKDRKRNSCWTGTRPDFVFLVHKKLPSDRFWVKYSDPDHPGLIRVHPIIVCEPARRKRLHEIVQEGDDRYGTVVQSKLLKSLKFKHKQFASSGLHSRIRRATDGGSTDSDPDPSPDPGAEIDGISPGQIRG
jgi:hypothetical protein